MKNTSPKILIAAGLVSLVALSIPSLADANARNRQKKLDQAARHELKKDSSELQRDRQDLSRLYRSGANRDEIAKKRAEIRGDWQEIAQDRHQLGSPYDGHRRDNYGYGNYGRYDNRGWWNNNNNNNNGRWNWGRVSDRNRWR